MKVKCESRNGSGSPAYPSGGQATYLVALAPR
jgi:hypothetical protein